MTSLSEEIHYAPDSINFSMFSVDELRKLSKVKVTNKVAINDLGQPLPDGLYDLRMGPYMRDYGICASCNMNFEHCPGHIGHIELELPVLNPLLRSVALSLLTRCCLKCSALLIPSATLQLFSAQFQLLRHGCLAEAIAAGDIVKINSAERTTSVGKGADAPDIELAPLLELSDSRSERVRKLLEETLLSEADESVSSFRNVDVRNVVVEKRALVRRFLSCRPNKMCLECRAVQPSLCDYSGQIIRTEKSAPGRRRKSVRNAETSPTEVRNTLTYVQARDVLRRLWQRESKLLSNVFGVLAAASDHDHPTDCLFVHALPVISPRLRPISKVKGVYAQHSLTELYSHVMVINEFLSILVKCKKEGTSLDQLPENENRAARAVIGNSIDEKLVRTWINLQCMVDCLVDVDMNKNFHNRIRIKQLRGIRQLLEKKEGIIRMNMMGKRVDYACRTVITPDPYLSVQEMGIPEVMAKRLTYPEPVTALNIGALQQAVLNGPNVYPGANAIEFGNGSMVLLKDRRQQLSASARSLLTPAQQTSSGSVPVPKVVHRHLATGDMVLLNRQPTLHRPSIMAHRVRVLAGEKTFRLHYSNCKSYNADFDGDEMNAHLPQGEEARSEAMHLAFSPYHFLVPKDGTPLGGLIQDHVIAGVKLSMRGRFLTRDHYMQMVECALTGSVCPRRLQLLPPAILKPHTLWTGKQVISTLLLNLTPPGTPAICLESTAQLGARSWQQAPPRTSRAGGALADGEMCESRVLIRHGHLLCGVLDKRQFGAVPFSLVHAFHELYGGLASSGLLSALSRLFTHCLQVFGFTLGVADILVRADADRARDASVCRLQSLGVHATRLALGLSDQQMFSEEDIRQQLQRCYLARDLRATRDLDRAYKKQLDAVNNDINKQCLPLGLLTKFPDNNLQLMVEAGAKGSKVNTMQISCLLGQIELEGKRPPRMMSGKTLPSFLPYDLTPRAGGFISGRFMTGIRPQEYFFHCMAGREGLIDTAVKTSRSGYLQRCLVKHLEGLTVGYDLSVRDADGSVIQLRYGEDGHETQRLQHLCAKQLHLYSNNRDAVVAPAVLERFRQGSAVNQVARRKRRIARWCRDSSRGEPGRQRSSGFLQFCQEVSGQWSKDQLVAAWRECPRRHVYERRARPCPDPVTADFRPDVHFSAVCERLDRLIDSHCDGDTHLASLLHYKCARACVQPGEPVGLVAAQSVGEPSTQMTLNTFHFAGRGDMNVTLGIPRLREILSASANTKTPSMHVPFWPRVTAARAERLRRSLSRVSMAQLLRDVTVTEQLQRGSSRLYQLRVTMLPRHAYHSQLPVTPALVMRYVETVWVRVLLRALSKAFNFRDSDGVLEGGSSQARSSDNSSEVALWSQTDELAGLDDVDDPGVDTEVAGGAEEGSGAATGADSSEEEAEADGDATATRSRLRRNDHGDYESEEEEVEECQEQQHADENDEQVEADDKQAEEIDKLVDRLSVERRIQCVLVQRTEHCHVIEYSYDTEHELWCQLTIRAATRSQCDIQAVVRQAAEQGVVRHVAGITRAFIIDDQGEEGGRQLVTEGVNLLHVLRYDRLLDLSRLYCNDLHALAARFGVEAASRAIVREIASVFAVYGINVSARHLSLVADYMTFSGRVAGFNRSAMDFVVSPLQQMTFETSIKFLRSAVVDGQTDRLRSPSARLVFGQPYGGGTGMFNLINKLTE